MKTRDLMRGAKAAVLADLRSHESNERTTKAQMRLHSHHEDALFYEETERLWRAAIKAVRGTQSARPSWRRRRAWKPG